MADEEEGNGTPSSDSSRSEKFEKKNGANDAVDFAKDVKSSGVQGALGKKALKSTVGESDMGKGAQETMQKVQDTVNKAQDAAKKVQAAVEAGKTAVTATVGILVNPVTWYALMVVVIVAAGLSFVQIVGQNENACATTSDGSSSDGDGGGGSAMTSEQQKKNANIIGTYMTTHKWKFLGDKAMTKEQAAAVVGNAFQESGLDPKAVNSKSNATGLWQWLDVKGLHQTASDMGKPWDDMGVQLTYLTRILNTSEKNAFKIYDQPNGRKFLDMNNKSVSELTNAWAWSYERMGKGEANVGNRISAANDFMKYFKPVSESEMPKVGDTWEDKFTSGGAVGGSGGSSDGSSGSDSGQAESCSSSGNYDNSSIVSMAVGIAWPRGKEDEAKDKHDGTHGKSSATPAYISAKAKGESLKDKDPLNLFSDCGRFVATVLKNTVDKDFPWGSTGEQESYMNAHPDLYEKVGQSHSDLKPGDIMVTGGEGGSGHIAIYGGQIDGKETTIDASMDERTGLVHDYYFGENLTDVSAGVKRQYTIFRSKRGGGSISDTAGSSGHNGANGKLPASDLCPAVNVKMRCDAAKDMNRLADAFKAHFHTQLSITEGYRDYATQVKYDKMWGQPRAAVPGTSNHGWGLAADMGSGIATYNSPQFKWMQANAGKYNFHWPARLQTPGAGFEPWHWEYNSSDLQAGS